MARVTLTDGAIAVLARQAADLVGPDVAVRVRPTTNDDPYRWTSGHHGWIVSIDPHVEAFIPAGGTPAQVLAELIDHLDEVSESSEHWGRAVPGCPGHRHMAQIDIDGEDVVLRCPASGEVVQRITPAVTE
jgi:hypothetical protein